MPYTDRFIASDNLITHLRPFINTITDPAILANYAGFLSVSAITVYELAVKDILNEFATKKNKVFGHFMMQHLSRINGRIQINDLKNNQVKSFGSKYLNNFDRILIAKENAFLTVSRISLRACYGNLITCRHEFVHQGSSTLTINEVIDNYNYGKEIIHSLNDAMKR